MTLACIVPRRGPPRVVTDRGRTIRLTQIYRYGVFGAAMAGLALLSALQWPADGSDLQLALFVTLLVVAGRSVDFRISAAGSTHLGTPALIAGVLLLEPALAAAAVTLGTLLSELIKRSEPSRVFFNIGQATLQALLVIGMLQLAGWDAADPDFENLFLIGVVFVAGLLAIAASALFVSLGARLEIDTPIRQLFLSVLLGGNSKLYLIDLSKICFGVTAAMLIAWSPLYILLIVIPVATMSHAIARGMNLSQRLERALHETEDSLAEAQRLAKLGSWEWELSGRHMRWSDQMFEITGLKHSDEIVSLGNLRSLLRLPDRKKLEQIVGRLMETRGTEEFDHEIVRSDGSVRYVHHVLAWAPADERAGERLVGTLLDITDRKQLELQLRHQAYHDGLTGLPNREFFLERLNDCLSTNPAEDPEKGVIFLDLDYFKQINDHYGHEAGDVVLIEVARRLKRHVSARDVVARLSGDEFTILVCNRGGEDRIVALANSLLQAVQRPVNVGGAAIPMTASAGIVHINGRHKTPSDVLREADNALYRAKGAGRNQVSIEVVAPEHDEPPALRTLA